MKVELRCEVYIFITIMAGINKLIDGYKGFYQKYFIENADVYKKLATGQSPSVAMIACSDSRVDPSIITGAEPGELFVIRNVANLVPPYQPDSSTYHGTSAALEFAINILKVEHVIVFGHSSCAGIRALVETGSASADTSFVDSWMMIADSVRQEIIHDHGDLSINQQAHICEKKAVEKSLDNLCTFPFIKDKVDSGKLKLHGWHFDIEKGELYHLNSKTNRWEKI